MNRTHFSIVLQSLTTGILVACFAIATADAQSGPPANPMDDDSAPLPEDPATVVAMVGQSPILWGDIEPKIDARIQQVLKEKNLTYSKEQLAPARKGLARGAIVQAIQNKMMSESFMLDQVGTQAAEKRQEVSAMMASRARQMFYENELKGLMEKHGTENLTELDAKLRETGMSLLARQREFKDQMLGHMHMRSMVDRDPKITIAEIHSAYAKKIDTYRHGAKARWEQLTVLFEKHPDRDEARKAITDMGREAYFGGNLQAVARDKSEEPFAVDGGLHDWTSQGSLASKPLDEQIFSIPLNRMSEVIEDAQGLHIIRVLERKPAGVRPLADVQEEIREELKQEKIAASQQEMLEQMRQKVPVWSLYPDDLPGAKPLRPAQVAARPRGNTDGRFR